MEEWGFFIAMMHIKSTSLLCLNTATLIYQHSLLLGVGAQPWILLFYFLQCQILHSGPQLNKAHSVPLSHILCFGPDHCFASKNIWRKVCRLSAHAPSSSILSLSLGCPSVLVTKCLLSSLPSLLLPIPSHLSQCCREMQ